MTLALLAAGSVPKAFEQARSGGAATPAGGGAQTAVAAAPGTSDDPVRVLVGRLDLERYKATIKGLTTFGDRRQGTDRNRAAIDWIETQLKSYGCTTTERLQYEYAPPARGAGGGTRGAGAGNRGGTPGAGTQAAGGTRQGGAAAPTPGTGATGAQAAQARRGGGGGRQGNPPRGFRGPTGVNNDPERQPDLELRKLNMGPTAPGPREQVYCTKVGAAHPDEMYIIGAHMDGHGYGAAANDDGSGTAIVMELARILNSPDVVTDRSIRFVLWNNEETGLNGSQAYVAQRRALQGIENPAGSGRYPEPRWLGMIQHDMMLFDHGMPGPDGKVSPEQRREADVNIEFAGTSKRADEAQRLAWLFRAANERYATDYPAAVGNRMSNTDSVPFQDEVAAISLREHERTAQIGSGWDPHWHQPTDVYETFSDADFRLGLNAAQTTLAAIAQLAGASLRP
jgi:hypothetical protein